MKQFTVVASPDAEEQLADIWSRASDPSAVTRAQNPIDRELAANPHGYGVPVAEDLWKIEVYPLRAYFEIRDLDRLVKILATQELP